MLPLYCFRRSDGVQPHFINIEWNNRVDLLVREGKDKEEREDSRMDDHGGGVNAPPPLDLSNRPLPSIASSLQELHLHLDFKGDER